MNDKSPWLSVIVAVVGVAGVAFGASLTYLSGSMSVNKDYVKIAMDNLNNQNSSPELRQWSTQILNELSPVPMSGKLRKELGSELIVRPAEPVQQIKILIPDLVKDFCPDLIANVKPGGQSAERHAEVDRIFISEYEKCRIKFYYFRTYIDKLNQTRRDVGTPSGH